MQLINPVTLVGRWAQSIWMREHETMGPEAALCQQIELYRAMTGEQRLAISLELHELSCEVARSGIRRQFPNAQFEEVERRLRQRLAMFQR